jgi:hypothetical protein
VTLRNRPISPEVCTQGIGPFAMETAVKKASVITLVVASAALAGCAVYVPPRGVAYVGPAPGPSYAYVAPAPAPGYIVDSYGYTPAERENLARFGHVYPRY